MDGTGEVGSNSERNVLIVVKQGEEKGSRRAEETLRSSGGEVLH